MDCQQCSEKATIHVTEIVDGTPRSGHFCKAHARAYAGDGRVPLADYLPDELEATQSQIEREESIPVALPDGSTTQVKLTKDMHDGLVITRVRTSADGQHERLFQLRLKVISERDD